jgi:hypothetical protein
MKDVDVPIQRSRCIQGYPRRVTERNRITNKASAKNECGNERGYQELGMVGVAMESKCVGVNEWTISGLCC